MLDYLRLDGVDLLDYTDTVGHRDVSRLEGILGFGVPRGESKPRSEQHGTYNRSRYTGSKIITVEGEAWGYTVDDAYKVWNTIAAALYGTLRNPAGGLLTWGRGGLDLQARVKLAGGVAPPIEGGAASILYQAQLEQMDPRAYSQALATAASQQGIAAAGGMAFSYEGVEYPGLPYIPNPSFASDLSGWTFDSFSTTARTTNPAEYDTGAAGLKKTQTSAGAAAGGNVFAQTSFIGTLLAGRTYTVSVRVNAPAGRTPFVRVAGLGGGTDVYGGAAGGWQTITVPYTPSMNASAYIEVNCGLANGEVLLIDTFREEWVESAGLTFPFDFDFTSTTALTVVNNGDIETPPVVRIYGNVLNPRYVLGSSGQQVKLSTAGFSGSATTYLEVDHAKRTVKVNGNTLHMEYLDAANTDFFDIPPGSSPITLTADAFGTDVRFEVDVRSAYDG